MKKNGKRMDAGAGGAAEDGLIVAHYGVAVEVLFSDGERRTVRVKRNSGHVVGDSVKVTGEILQRLPRKNELRRRDARGSLRLVAANLDILGVVVAPGTPTGFIDRAVVAARAAGLQPFIASNKCDLPEGAALAEELHQVYGEVLSVFPVSAVRGDRLETLRAFLNEGHRGAFVGSTGVGKSSLLNALCPEINLKVGELSEYHGLGRHTTTVSTLHGIPGGGELVDTPGFREFGLVDITAEDVPVYFPGLEKLDTGGCRFHNCRHRQEPGCGVIALVEQGIFAEERYDAYLQLLAEAEMEEEDALRRSWRS